MRIKDYSLIELEELAYIVKSIRKEVRNNQPIMVEIESNDGLVKIQSNDFEQFSFEISHIESDKKGNSITFLYSMSPWAETVVKKNGAKVNTEVLLKRFKLWVELLWRYNKLNFEDPIVTEYENEIYNYFKILDEDAEYEPFSIEQQVLLLKSLNKIEQIVKNEDVEYVEAIIENVSEAKTELVKSSKNKVMRRISKVLAYSRKSSLKLFKDFIDVFKKEMMKKTLWEGVEKLEELTSILKNLPI